MKKLALILGSFVVFVSLLAGAAATAIGAGSKEDPHKSPKISVDEARAVVAHVVPAGDSEIKYLGTQDRPGIRVYTFSGPGFSASVDVSDGHLSVLSLTVPNETGPAMLSADDARRIAVGYLNALGSPVDGLEVEVRAASGSGTPAFTVMFRRTKNGVVLPDYRMVEVDAVQGRVFSFIDVRRPYVDPPPAKISKADAKRLASQHASVAGESATTDDALLMLTWDKAGNQKLVWLVQVSSGTAGAASDTVIVDADSGSVSEGLDQ